MSPAEETASLLRELGVESGGTLASHSPIDGSRIGAVTQAGASDVAAACERAQSAFLNFFIFNTISFAKRDCTTTNKVFCFTI